MSDIHIDTETLGLGTDAAVLSIGIVDASAIDEYEHEIDLLPRSADSRFVWHDRQGQVIGVYVVFDLMQAMTLVHAGHASMDVNTVNWWRSQEDPNAAALLKAAPISDSEQLAAMNVVQELIDRYAAGTVWCRGASFDFPILNNLFPLFGLPGIRNFRAQRDVRTFEAEVGSMVGHEHVSAIVKHHAFYDALAQAQNVNAIKRLMDQRLSV